MVGAWTLPVRKPSRPRKHFSSSPVASAPFRVIDDSDPRSRPPIVDSGLYTPGEV